MGAGRGGCNDYRKGAAIFYANYTFCIVATIVGSVAAPPCDNQIYSDDCVFCDIYGIQYTATKCSNPDPGSGAIFDPWIRDPGWKKS